MTMTVMGHKSNDDGGGGTGDDGDNDGNGATGYDDDNDGNGRRRQQRQIQQHHLDDVQ